MTQYSTPDAPRVEALPPVLDDATTLPPRLTVTPSSDTPSVGNTPGPQQLMLFDITLYKPPINEQAALSVEIGTTEWASHALTRKHRRRGARLRHEAPQARTA
jgi:hypothetical protein